MNIPQKGFYKHHKHDPEDVPYRYMYEVIGLGRNTEDRTLTVLYRPLYANSFLSPANFCSRPLEMFLEDVEWKGVMVPRFERIADPELIFRLNQKREEMYSDA